ncbi:hypothetical protein LCGC14_0456640 [marine sediment metagenome]|uniref:Uncharacterized protein n=1 Tax=marine sediment metagenome TaxID=412755 RepID=A0A0F9SZ67_9ZZZZ
MTGFLLLLGILISVTVWIWVQLRDVKKELLEKMDLKITNHEEGLLSLLDTLNGKIEQLREEYSETLTKIIPRRASQPKTFSPSRAKASPQPAKRTRASKGSGKK